MCQVIQGWHISRAHTLLASIRCLSLGTSSGLVSGEASSAAPVRRRVGLRVWALAAGALRLLPAPLGVFQLPAQAGAYLQLPGCSRWWAIAALLCRRQWTEPSGLSHLSSCPLSSMLGGLSGQCQGSSSTRGHRVLPIYEISFESIQSARSMAGAWELSHFTDGDVEACREDVACPKAHS